MTEQAQQEAVPGAEQGQEQLSTALGDGEQGQEQGGEGNPQGEQSQALASADDYSVDIEGFNFDDFKGIEENKAFLDRAHEAGITNDQLKFVLGEYNDIIPKVAEGMQQFKTEDCTATLQKEWGDDTKANLGLALKAAQSAGLTIDQINADPAIGNNPAVIKLLTHFGKQMQEDVPPQNTQPTTSEDVSQLMASEAYMNPNHPDHKRVYEQVQRSYEKNYRG
ncbi:hypothetical protein [Acinetobacter sp. HY1485]|uniref:hypothetical protein n=1 Tax=Acinetobacter sp. HY1485 TaxID=2970918 RepID=UPI0022B9C505|nr:hypothetical protein [Acinetobacter sp. HY1485]